MSKSFPDKTHSELLNSLKSKGLVAPADEESLLELLDRKDVMQNLQERLIVNLKKQLKRSS